MKTIFAVILALSLSAQASEIQCHNVYEATDFTLAASSSGVDYAVTVPAKLLVPSLVTLPLNQSYQLSGHLDSKDCSIDPVNALLYRCVRFEEPGSLPFSVVVKGVTDGKIYGLPIVGLVLYSKIVQTTRVHDVRTDNLQNIAFYNNDGAFVQGNLAFGELGTKNTDIFCSLK